MTVDCIIKLGGSAVTVKNNLETVKLEEISKFAKVIQALGLNTRCILVHGAGSFGHFQAKEYGVALGYHGNEDNEETSKIRTGFCKTRVSVTKLNHIIVSNLVSHGVNAVGVSSCGRWVTDDGKVVQSDTESIRELLFFMVIAWLTGVKDAPFSVGIRSLRSCVLSSNQTASYS